MNRKNENWNSDTRAFLKKKKTCLFGYAFDVSTPGEVALNRTGLRPGNLLCAPKTRALEKLWAFCLTRSHAFRSFNRGGPPLQEWSQSSQGDTPKLNQGLIDSLPEWMGQNKSKLLVYRKNGPNPKSLASSKETRLLVGTSQR